MLLEVWKVYERGEFTGARATLKNSKVMSLMSLIFMYRFSPVHWQCQRDTKWTSQIIV